MPALMSVTEAATVGVRLRFEWLTTAPNPRLPATGRDAGQRGWKLHAVNTTGLSDGLNCEDLGRISAACGVKPAHGWGVDLFIKDQCDRCVRALSRSGYLKEPKHG